MKYKLLYTKVAIKDIKKLDKVAKKKIRLKIENYSLSPTKFSKKLINSKIGTFRWRAGNYRIVFDMTKDSIVILRVGHRREIYK